MAVARFGLRAEAVTERTAAGEGCPKGRLAERIWQICGRGGMLSVRTGADFLGRTRIKSGFEKLDEALGGGFEQGAVHELISGSTGAAGRVVALCTAARAAGTQRWIVYIDTGRDFYPPGACLLGVPLARLVVVRPQSRAEALWACEQVLHSRQVAAVVMPVRYLDWHESRRLQLAAEVGENLGLVITTAEAEGGHSFAASRVRFEPLASSHTGESAVTSLWGGGQPGLKRQPHLPVRVVVLKVRGQALVEPFVLEPGEAGGMALGRAGGLWRRVAG
jgi:hypothetical protein